VKKEQGINFFLHSSFFKFPIHYKIERNKKMNLETKFNPGKWVWVAYTNSDGYATMLGPIEICRVEGMLLHYKGKDPKFTIKYVFNKPDRIFEEACCHPTAEKALEYVQSKLSNINQTCRMEQ
jgi:hypothetical protein